VCEFPLACLADEQALVEPAELLLSAEVVAVPVAITGPGTASISLWVPSLMNPVWASCQLQGWAFAPGANSGQQIVSNGLDWLIGCQ
jgi:hypothetical protein